jgi:hypothetical protein
MKICFIIAHKYFVGSVSNIEYHIQNINLFYEDAGIIIVDNNSSDAELIFDSIRKYKNVILLDNNIESKYELGAYQVGISYVLDRKLDYDYYVCVQDNMIIKNKYDFNNLRSNDVEACTIYTYHQDWLGCPDYQKNKIISSLTKIGLYDNMEKTTFCFACSFIISKNKISKLNEYLEKIAIENKDDSQAAERFLARILYDLNNGINFDIDGSQTVPNRDFPVSDVKTLITKHYFCKYHGLKN